MREFFLFFFVQTVTYLTATVSMRAVQAYNYPVVILTDIVLASFGFFVIRRIAQSHDEAKTYLGFSGYVTGGIAGSVLALQLTRYFGI